MAFTEVWVRPMETNSAISQISLSLKPAKSKQLNIVLKNLFLALILFPKYSFPEPPYLLALP